MGEYHMIIEKRKTENENKTTQRYDVM